MLRSLYIFLIGLLSCHDANDKKIIMIESPISHLGSLVQEKGFFHWDKWETTKNGTFYHSDHTLAQFAKGHVRIDGSYGDIDENGILDIIIITGLATEDSLRLIGKAQPRHMLVFLDQGNFSFRNNKAIPWMSCNGQSDPYSGHLALTGKFIIRETCIIDKKYRSEYQFAFKPSQGDWILDTLITESSDLKGESYTLDTMTKSNFGNIWLRTFDIKLFKSKYR